jgi:hypothetical protein
MTKQRQRARLAARVNNHFSMFNLCFRPLLHLLRYDPGFSVADVDDVGEFDSSGLRDDGLTLTHARRPFSLTTRKENAIVSKMLMPF